MELRQVGPRDEAKLMGGVGRCGFTLCCASFLTEFSPLSIKTAKEQGLSLEPAKISGTCGRLLCCLGYEAEYYRSMKGKLPGMNKQVTTPLGDGVVVGVNAIKETVMVQMESQAAVEFPASKVTVEGTAETSQALVCLGDELPPLHMGAEVVVGDGEGGWWGREGLPQQSHPGFCWGMAGLSQVTGEATTDDVVPFVTTPPALGNDVVEGDVLGFAAAVLTGVLVAVEHLETGETLLQAGALDELG